MTKKSSKNLLDSVETLIGQNAVIEGNLKTDKVIRIDGKINGNIDAAGILLGADGLISGDIKTEVIMIGGAVKGNIFASESIEILPKAKVSGDIQTTLLTIAEGGFFEGKSSIINSEETNVAGAKKK
ncbi:MAG: polymer-forming cytoskeletal protein [Endomicrobia bacterium]|nr:polymer-forming cytoskeletal protein [Endomicrobiia bacterium]MCL2506734.1 polymer-forming cytoskeletal protein [Endomicrobiia bacterium]